MRTINDMVRQEVLCCLSSLVSTLATGYPASGPHGKQFAGIGSQELADLTEQAFELACPVDDYEEAAIQEGWQFHDEWQTWVKASAHRDPREDQEEYAGAEELCREYEIEPYQREIYQHWAVTDWLADKLDAAGEKVDRDFANICVWARSTSGQGIASDGVIQRIYAETHK